MSKYLYIFRGGDQGLEDATPEQLQAHMGKWLDWINGIAATGKLLGGEPLQSGGKVLSGKDDLVITDGPFAEGKELVGGYLLVEVADEAEAIEIAKGCPVFKDDGSLELREVSHVENT